MNPTKASLRYPLVSVILATMAVTVGIHAFLTMPRTEDPSITIRQGLVLAAYPGATSEQVEQQVTRKLEEHIFKFPEVRKQKTYSTSRPGLVTVKVELEENVKNADQFWAKLRLELIETAATELPAGVRGPIVNSDFGDTVAMLLAIHGRRYGYRELRDYVDRIQDELRGVRNVGKLATYGEQSEQIRITSSLERMSQYFADPLRVIESLQQRNIVRSAGNLETGAEKIPLRATGLFTTEDQIGSVLVDVSRTGQPVYIRDFAGVERRYQDPSFVVRYDGEPSVMLSVEMQKGKNIVELGDELGAVFGRLSSLLPPDIHVDPIANQPAVVKTRIADLSREFLLAIGAVILVTIVLLPFRVAVIAAVAIPVTVMTSLGVLDNIGVQLNQVSIAALIMVLGIVVDDAIVIADNYVDCLDRGIPRRDAAWQSVEEVLVPVVTATLTIIASFLPLLILTGSVGEFISALPITVAVALCVSFVVAILLTPLLCRFFIRQGLHRGQAEQRPGQKKTSMLDRLQAAYNWLILFFMRRKPLAVVLGLAAVAAGILMLKTVPQQFFPSAERNQFVIDVWMPRVARIEATADAMGRIERALGRHAAVAHYAAFVGQSAPRFYYNVSPQDPDPAYGQFIVNTKDEKTVPALVSELRQSLAGVAPEALIIVKELQQGMTMEAPVEVRVSGLDIAELQRIGTRVEEILHRVPYAQSIYNDYFGDSYLVDVDIDTEISNRLGLTNASVSSLLAGAFSGDPVSTFWEGDRAITILLRLEAGRRDSFEDVRNAYVPSAITHASVPLRSIAELTPRWQTSRIVRRNGVRTLTVRAFPQRGHYASQILNAIDPQVKALALPGGYSFEYGGEVTNRNETLPMMTKALAVSLVAIFLVLLMQFRNLSEPLLVMCSIPLALFGAMLGLLLTRNPFGFTAFTGMIALCGIVVRNAIILVDYTNEKLRDGHSLETAAIEAGERRLRPIFLTTMAAAVGVTPMIISGSSLWSPLASVIAVGLVSSMFFTLIVVPVLFVLVKSRAAKPAAGAVVAILLALSLASVPARAATRQLTLPEAVDLALKQNSALKIARARVRENRQKEVTARADYFPQLANSTDLLGLSDKQLVTVPAGSLGTIPGFGPFPPEAVALDQGSNAVLLTNTTLGQPLTQLFKIHAANNVASAQRRVTEAELKKDENEVILGVHQLYYGLLAARKQIDVVRAEIAAGEEALREARNAVDAGNALEVAAIGAHASLLHSRQALLAAENQVSDLNADMDDALGLPLDMELDLADVKISSDGKLSRQQYLDAALAQNPEVQAARETVSKARSALRAAQYEYVPDIGAFARHTYQSGVPFVAHNFGTFGFQMTWNIFDWGKRKGVIGERDALLTEAEENLRRVTDRVSVEVDKAYRKLERSELMISVAAEALALERENQRLSGNEFKAGVISEAKNAQAVAGTSKAELDELQARLAHELALAEMDRVAAIRSR
ncbi:MAG: efflux RND transporter permease subunit [Bryobacteraceae bacterium]|jgi:multidrug efflux pump subunit AcrB/outer membrane protein TolC